MHARVMNIRFPPKMKAEVASVARGLAPVLKQQRGFKGLQVLTDPSVGEGIMVTLWETEADAEASEIHSSYIAQMSMMSSFLSEPLVPRTYEVSVRTRVPSRSLLRAPAPLRHQDVEFPEISPLPSSVSLSSMKPLSVSGSGGSRITPAR